MSNGMVSDILEDFKSVDITEEGLDIIEETDGVSEWVMDPLDDASPRSMAELGQMAMNCL